MIPIPGFIYKISFLKKWENLHHYLTFFEKTLFRILLFGSGAFFIDHFPQKSSLLKEFPKVNDDSIEWVPRLTRTPYILESSRSSLRLCLNTSKSAMSLSITFCFVVLERPFEPKACIECGLKNFALLRAVQIQVKRWRNNAFKNNSISNTFVFMTS